MAKIFNPVQFSSFYKINGKLLESAGVIDPTLNVDTKLFIDPLLLEKSAHDEISKGAVSTYESHFGIIIKLLAASTGPSSVAWKSAEKLLTFPEIKGIGLGYGSNSAFGSGSGIELRRRVMSTAKQIIELGVSDPDLFIAMALLEEGFGPDRISDMTANVIIGDLIHFNHRILVDLPVPLEDFRIRLKNGRAYEAKLPLNPFSKERTPVILIPADILRDLPIAASFDEVADVAARNQEHRQDVNEQISAIWERKSKEGKGDVKKWAMSSKKEFDLLIEMMKGANPSPYDLVSDPLGEIFWRKLRESVAVEEPLELRASRAMDISLACEIVDKIIAQFKFLIEERRFSEELYSNGRPRPEKAAQKLFFAVADSYCKANNLDLTPEADTDNGPVDFKFSNGYQQRVLVEIKLSKNGKVVSGYTKQLETYKNAEQTAKGYYLVIDVGQMGNKDKALMTEYNSALNRGEKPSPIIFVDGLRRKSASKL